MSLSLLEAYTMQTLGRLVLKLEVDTLNMHTCTMNAKSDALLISFGTHAIFYIMNINKLHSLQSLVRTTRRTKTANITKNDVTSASHRQKVTVLQKFKRANYSPLPHTRTPPKAIGSALDLMRRR